MSAEDLACCLKCQMTFTTHEELFVHSCVFIKVETNDFEESKELDFSKQWDFKREIVQSNPSETESDYSPKKKKCKQRKMSKRKIETVRKIGEDSQKTKGKMKRHNIKKEKPKYEFDEEPNILEEEKNTKLSEGMNLDLTEEFIIFILQQVDELCENIKNGDPDDQRTLEVNQNLNNAVSCYRTKLHEKSDPFSKIKVKEQKHSAKIGKNSKDDSIKVDRRFKKESKNKNPTKDKKPLNIVNEVLFSFISLRENDVLHCSLCNYAQPLKLKGNMFRHLKFVHKNELKAKSEEGIDFDLIEQKFDCEKGICLKLYGPFHRKLWCLKCTEARVEGTQIGKTMIKLRKHEKKLKQKESGITKEKEICPECGAKVTNVKQHIKFKHEIDKQKCPQCGKEYKNVLHLQNHMKFHEKVPCPHCGKPYALSKLNLHIESQHTSNEDKRFKCDVCGKGFNASQPLKDHINIHTGEKPYKCKYCSATFASRGNHGMHERSHLGHRRK